MNPKAWYLFVIRKSITFGRLAITWVNLSTSKDKGRSLPLDNLGKVLGALGACWRPKNLKLAASLINSRLRVAEAILSHLPPKQLLQTHISVIILFKINLEYKALNIRASAIGRKLTLIGNWNSCKVVDLEIMLVDINKGFSLSQCCFLFCFILKTFTS